MRLYLEFIVLLAILGLNLVSSVPKKSDSNESNKSRSKECDKSESNEPDPSCSNESGSDPSFSNESGSDPSCSDESDQSVSKEYVKKPPKRIVTMDVNRGVACCGPEKIINHKNCRPNELYWIPCLIDYLDIEGQPPPYTCFSLSDLDCYLSTFPCFCKTYCPNGYGHNKTCIYVD